MKYQITREEIDAEGYRLINSFETELEPSKERALLFFQGLCAGAYAPMSLGETELCIAVMECTDEGMHTGVLTSVCYGYKDLELTSVWVDGKQIMRGGKYLHDHRESA